MNKTQTQICKGIAIVMVFFHHLFDSKRVESHQIIYTFLGMERTLWIAQAFKVSVSVFVFLTAYGYAKSDMSMPHTRMAVAEKMIQRYFRLMFGFWFVFVLAHIFSKFTIRTGETVYGERLFEQVVFGGIDGLGLAQALKSPTLNITWWYMSLALLNVFFIPFLIQLTKIIGPVIIPLAILIVHLGGFSSSILGIYIFPIVLGIVLANYNVFEFVAEKCKKGVLYYASTIIIDFVLLGCTLKCRQNFSNLECISDGIFAMALSFSCYMFIYKIPVLKNILILLGKHSLNLFLIHTFYYYYYFDEFIYSFKSIWLMLIFCTMLTSIIIEKMKKVIHYDEMEQKVSHKVVILMKKYK